MRRPQALGFPVPPPAPPPIPTNRALYCVVTPEGMHLHTVHADPRQSRAIFLGMPLPEDATVEMHQAVVERWTRTPDVYMHRWLAEGSLSGGSVPDRPFDWQGMENAPRNCAILCLYLGHVQLPDAPCVKFASWSPEHGFRDPEGHCPEEPVLWSFIPTPREWGIALVLSSGAYVSPWKPIATAPRDGTPILLAWGDGVVSMGRWGTGQETRGIGLTPRTFPWQFFEQEGDGPLTPNYAVDGPAGPSHWMPLPEFDPARLPQPAPEPEPEPEAGPRRRAIRL